jgi:hypothetical protein
LCVVAVCGGGGVWWRCVVVVGGDWWVDVVIAIGTCTYTDAMLTCLAVCFICSLTHDHNNDVYIRMDSQATP